ncbi:anti-sigma factor C-terminal domain-containing protein [Alkalicoccobacillus gibsonii]|uniref:anti-sigma factor C-terminal domain-containing protein n=1 Tax=Alkalicoccobacillus gibsonii TaxID=79881 RepID=UPI0019325A8D|nr:anti-sigma factor C-terminal domain-containing protein [Alkalicoccobacillus gibsonii]MBM0065953.1 anti-sigma factor C-terminal domain-containing protein [Alkalicoccobacillus gibsonii]
MKEDDHKSIYEKKIEQVTSQFEGMPVNKQKKLIKKERLRANVTNVVSSLSVLLLILPLMTLGSYIYYGISDRANNYIEVTLNAIYLTKPNTDIFNIESQIGMFTIDLDLEMSKRIGQTDYHTGDYSYAMSFNELTDVKERSYAMQPIVDRQISGPTFIHPYKGGMIDSPGTEILLSLPDSYVAEVHISFDEVYSVDEVSNFLPNEADPVWIAVDTGRDDSIEGTNVVKRPFGFPVSTMNYWSTVFLSENNRSDAFIQALNSLSEHQDFTESLFSTNKLFIDERIHYIEENGVSVYGATVTGSVEDLRKLIDVEQVRNIEVGETHYGDQ